MIAADAGTPPARPNIVYILADDLGWSDLSIHKGSIPTPQVDKLFHEGVELRHFMGWCVCSPTRAMLLTGRHPFRVGTGPEVGGELEPQETTIAEGFKANGYATGVFGKWHNGEDPDTPEYRKAFDDAWKVSKPNKKIQCGFGVNEHGFDEAWVYYGGGADYFTRRTVQGTGPVSWWHNREYRPQDVGYTEDLITQHVLEFIRANRERPFFCYVPFHVVHAPYQAKDSDLQDVDAKVTDETKRKYAAMVMAMDRNIGTIRGELEKLGLRENTIVVFTSDNGATKDGSNLPLRGGKHSVYEGGVRMPTVFHWPKGGLSGGRQWEGLCGAFDMFPTLIDMVGGKMPETRPLDGRSIWPALRDGKESPVESYYWVWRNCDAIRTANWKMLRYFDHNELYDIRKDESEATNVADGHPDVVKDLTVKMDKWAASLGAALTHQPVPGALNAAPQPDGEALEISVTVTDKAKPRDMIVVQVANLEGPRFATDYIEYDIAVAPDSLQQGFYYSPYRGNDAKSIQLEFRKGEGIDQFGREQVTGPGPKGGPGVWEHRVIGLCSGAPGWLPLHGIVFTGRKAGTFKVYLANLRLRRAGGTLLPVWSEGKHTRTKKIGDTEMFKDVKVRTVKAADLKFEMKK
jgi:arylsulfatase A-like enzyme